MDTIQKKLVTLLNAQDVHGKPIFVIKMFNRYKFAQLSSLMKENLMEMLGLKETVHGSDGKGEWSEIMVRACVEEG